VVPGSIEKIFHVDTHIGCATSGLVADARALVDKLSSDVNAVLAQAELRARMTEIGVVLKGSQPAAFAEVVKADQAYWSEVIRVADVRLD
jgi:tripartite-type tricarboxylate transporter receptor subunit TctC